MKKTVLHYLIQTLCILFVATGSYAQSYKTLSAEQKQFIRLRSQLIFKVANLNDSSLKIVLESNQNLAIQYKDKSDAAFIETLLTNNKKITIVTEKNIDAFLLKHPSITLIKPSLIEHLNLQNTTISDSTDIRFKGLEELGSINFINNKSITDSIVYGIWRKSGKLPNFIYADSSSITKASKIASVFNSTKKVFGVVKTNKHLLKNVSFKHFSVRKANGYFSFPINTTGKKPILIPYKAGYYFSPDIIYTNNENKGNQKEFIGFPLDPTFGLTDHFVFGKTISNHIRNNTKNIIYKQVQTVQDSIRGKVGYFNKRAYIDTGIESRSALKTSFTITAWIKPTELGFAHSILGKGEHFVLKIHQGFLTFTMAGIKDYISFSSPISLNKWTHISLIYSEVHNELYFYINGGKTDTVPLISNYITSDYNLLIGNNLWEEFFIGYLNSIKIWERELNSSEILLQYNNPNLDTKNFYSSLFLGIGFLLLISIFILYRQKSKKRALKIKSLKKAPHKSVILSFEGYKEQLFCFGPLQIMNEDGVDIAQKLSPKLKQLFLIFFIYSFKDGKGITTKKLTEILWPGMDPKSAKNTRGTSIQNLRAILSSCSEVKFHFLNKHWFLEISDDCFCDYDIANKYLELFTTEQYNETLLEEKLSLLLSLLKRGRLFTNSNAAWLDPYLEKFSYQITKECFHYLDSLSIEKHSKILLDCIEIIHIYDDLNEKALRLKLQILIQQGKLSLARTLYDNFTKLYKKIYKESYPVTFEKSIS